MIDRRAARFNLEGMFWMIAAMAAFAVEDAMLKQVSMALPVSQMLMLFGGGGALIFALLARRNHEPLFSSDVTSRPMLVRVLFEVVGRLFYILAVALTPLSSATVILQATPLLVVAFAALFMGETVGPRRWLAIFIGILGVVVIIRPGTDSFSVLSLLAVIGLIGFAGRDLASRAAPAALSTSILGLYGFLTLILAGGLFALWEQKTFVQPDPVTALWLAGTIAVGVGAYSCLMKAMRTGEVSAVTPFRYTRLLFGVALGVVWFGEQLDAAMVLGGALIVVSGLFIITREKRG